MHVLEWLAHFFRLFLPQNEEQNVSFHCLFVATEKKEEETRPEDGEVTHTERAPAITHSSVRRTQRRAS